MESLLRDGVDLQTISGGAISGDAHFLEDNTAPAKIRQLLDSNKEPDKIKGMKLLLAMLSKGTEIQEFFPDVVKNVVVKNIEVKKMVYIYLVHYADYNASCREISLLSINSFQKDLSSNNQLIRGLALRVMTSIRVLDIIQIQLHATKKCANDSSPYVRKCAANSLCKIYYLDNEQILYLKEILDKLLSDSSTMVLGSSVVAFNEICPNSFEILHRHYRKLCHLLADMDEWSQVIVLEVLTRYIRCQFTDPAPGVFKKVKSQSRNRSYSALEGQSKQFYKRRVVKKAFYSDEEDESEEEEVEISPRLDVENNKTSDQGETQEDVDLDPDHSLVLKASLPLLKSRNSGVVLGVCSLHYYCGPVSVSLNQQLAKALVRILRTNREVQFVVLNTINKMAKDRPEIFRPYLFDFLIKSSDPLFNRLIKLDVLTSLSCKENIRTLLKEMQTYIKDSNNQVVCSTIASIGKLADIDRSISDSCMQGIMNLLICSKDISVVAQCVVVLRQLIQQNPNSPSSSIILRQLTKLLIQNKEIEDASAKASIIWMVGENSHLLAKASPDILRILAQRYTDEDTVTKTQILNLAIKLSIHNPNDDNIQNLMIYILELSRYDSDVDLRDRSRFFTALMGLAPSNEGEENSSKDAFDNEKALSDLSDHANGIMISHKLPPVTYLGSNEGTDLKFSLGSLSSFIGHKVDGYEYIPDWPDVQPDPGIRDSFRFSSFEKSFNRNNNMGKISESDSNSEIDKDFDIFANNKSKKPTANPDYSSSYESNENEQDNSASESEFESDDEGVDSNSTEGSKSDDEDDETESGEDVSESESAESVASLTTTQNDNVARIKQLSQRFSSQSIQENNLILESSKSITSTNFDNVEAISAIQLDPVSISHLDSLNSCSKSMATHQFDNTNINSSTATSRNSLSKKVYFGDSLEDFLNPSHPTPGNVNAPGSFDQQPTQPTPSHKTQISDKKITRQGIRRVKKQTPKVDIVDDKQSSILDVPFLEKSVDDNFIYPRNNTAANAFQDNDLLSLSEHENETQQSLEREDIFSGFENLHSDLNNNSFSPHSSSRGSLEHINPVQANYSLINNELFSIKSNHVNNNNKEDSTTSMNLSYDLTHLNDLGPESKSVHPSHSIGTQIQINTQKPTEIQANFNESMNEYHSEPKVILKPQLGGGLSIQILYRFGVQPESFSGGVRSFLLLKNSIDEPIRRIKVNFPFDLKKSPIADIPLLEPNQEICIDFEIVLSGVSANKPLKVDVRTSRGAFTGLLPVNDWDLILPFRLLPNEFESIRSRLKSLNEISKTFDLKTLGLSSVPEDQIESIIMKKFMRLFNVYVVQGVGIKEILLSGYIRKGIDEIKVLFTIESSSETLSYRINCEDPIICTTINDFLSSKFNK